MLIASLVGLLTFFTPLLFWTITPSIFVTPKDFLVILAVLTLLGYFIYRLLKSTDFSIHRSPLTLPLVIFILAIIASLITNPEGRPEALSSKGLTLILLPFIALSTLTISDVSRLTRLFVNGLLLSTTLLSLHSLLSLSFLSRSPFMPTYMQNVSFTPTGSYLTTLVLILIGLTTAVTLLKHNSAAAKNIAAGLIVLHTIAIVAIVSLMLPGGSLTPTLISYQASWSIALDALKSLRSLLFGIGLSNYSLLYATVKPLSINLTPLWNALPTTGASELLTLLPTAGVLATMTFLYLITKGLIWAREHTLAVPFILTSLAFLVVPISLPIYLLFFLFLSLIAPRQHDIHLSPLTGKVVAIIFLALGIFILTTIGKVYASEYLMRQAQKSLEASDSQSAYDLHLQAVTYSPQISNYHLSFAEINFRLASALSQKENLSDAERETISQLVQQSINSSKTAITLRPNSSTAWISLAKIYQNLINVAEGSDGFAIEAYNRAVSLDRANPLLRLEYGNLLSQLSVKAEAENDQLMLRNRARNEFQTAIQLKNDYANGYYNLAKLYESESDYTNATAAMQQVLKYLDSATAEYSKAESELEILKSKLPKSTTSPTPPTSTTDDQSQLSDPSPLPSPLPGGPVELP